MKKILLFLITSCFALVSFAQLNDEFSCSETYAASPELALKRWVNRVNNESYIQLMVIENSFIEYGESVFLEVQDEEGNELLIKLEYPEYYRVPSDVSPDMYLTKFLLSEKENISLFARTIVKMSILNGEETTHSFKFEDGSFNEACKKALIEDIGAQTNTVSREASSSVNLHDDERLVSSGGNDKAIRKAGDYLVMSGSCRYMAFGLFVLSGITCGVGLKVESKGLLGLSGAAALAGLACELASMHFTCKAGKSLRLSPTSLRFNF